MNWRYSYTKPVNQTSGQTDVLSNQCLENIKLKKQAYWKLALPSLCKKTPSNVLNIVKDMLNVFLNITLERDKN